MSEYKTYTGISLDHSISMRGLTRHAARDYNNQVQLIKEKAEKYKQDIIVSRVTCAHGHTAEVKVEVANSSAAAIKIIPENSYHANGRGTPLYDSVGKLIEMFEQVPDYIDPTVSFLLIIITDGEENSSRTWSARSLGQKIKQLQATDRWTIVFRVPRGYRARLVRDLNLYEGNVQEWDQSIEGIETSTVQTTVAMDSYFDARSKGLTATRSFYANLDQVDVKEVKAVLTDISSQVQLWDVQTDAEGRLIRDFVEHKLGDKMLKGAAFYELIPGKKTADKVQANKLIIIRDKNTGATYSGAAARDLIGLSHHADTRVRPGDLGNWMLFIQSTSVNRKLKAGTQLLYWKNVGKSFKEGPSA